MESRRLGGYELREVLGEGGMGTVYLAHDPTLDRPAAVKVIRAKALSREGKERFLREARSCSKINHANIITVYAAGEENGEPYMAMEFIEGETLRAVLERGAVDWRTATRWIVQLLDALGRLHAEGIVHRDLKPENIMVTREGVIKLMDFGLAHLQTQTAITEEGTTLGTVPYMSPEQVLGRKVDARSDLFSLATIYHEMLTGVHPFRGEHPMAVMYSIRNETPKPIHVQSSDVPVALQPVLDHAFAKETDKRFADAAAFRDAILAAVPEVSGTTVVAQRTSPLKMTLLIAVVSSLVLVAILAGWNAVENKRSAARRTEAANLHERAMLQSDRDSKEDLLRQAVAKDPTFGPPYNELGLLAFQDGFTDVADSLYRKAARLSPRFAPALVNVGTSYYDHAEYDSAIVYYQRALAGIDADTSIVCNQLSAAYLKLGRHREAKDALVMALSREETRGDVRGFLLMNLGKMLAAEGDSTAARASWNEALAETQEGSDLRRQLEALLSR